MTNGQSPPSGWSWKIGQDHLALARPAQLFIAYHPRDEEFLIELETHLSVLKRQGLIESWHAGMISAGDAWEQRLLEKLEKADFILLLLSADFVSSDLHVNILMQQAFMRLEANRAFVLPIRLRHVDLDSTPLSKLQCLPDTGKPVKAWNDRDEAWLNVASGVRRAIRERVDLINDARESRTNPDPEENLETSILKKSLLPRFRDGQFLEAWNFLQIQQSINAIECMTGLKTTRFDPFYYGQFLTADDLNQLILPIQTLCKNYDLNFPFKHFPISDGSPLTADILNELIDGTNTVIATRLRDVK